MKIKEVVQYGVQVLKENNIDDYQIKAKVLLQYVLKESKEYLVINCDDEVEELKEIEYKKCIEELIKGKPLQYITNRQEFMNLNFYVDENVLIPQPDTEVLVEQIIKEIEMMCKQNSKETVRVLDLCTGSGAISISIAKYFEEEKQQNEKIEVEVYASDISKEALNIAEKNAKLNGVNINFIQSNMFDDISKNVSDTFDFIVSNPPYIETQTIKNLPKDVQAEPHIALDGGLDGLDFYRKIAESGYLFLNLGGKILLEIGYNQKETVTNLFKQNGIYDKIECIKDFSGNDRVLKVELK